jgi:hypothetical protein
MISHRGPNTLIALAPAQARLHVGPVMFLRRNRAVSADLAARVTVLLAGIGFLQWPLVAVGALLLIWPLRRYLLVRRTLYRGSPLAAKVISIDPPLVACLAEMSRALNATYPCLVVQPADLRFEHTALESGDRVAVVGLPHGGVPARAERLHVFIVSSVMDAPSSPLLELVPEWHWDDLEDGLFQVDHPYRPGLYPLG